MSAVGAVTQGTGSGRRKRRWLLWLGGVFAVLVVAGVVAAEWVLRHAEPFLRRRVVQTLSARFNSPVELDELHLAYKDKVLVTGGGLRILYLAGPTMPDANPAQPPMLSVQHFAFTTGWRELLQPTTRVVTVNVERMEIHIPPKRGDHGPDNPKRRGQPRWGIAVDKIVCTDTKLVLETNRPDKKPLVFAVSGLTLTDVGAKKPFNYEATLVNPKPVGDIHSVGHFGPWQDDNPRDTPLDGSYEFTNVDLSSIKGIGGTLSSTGKFGGTLGNITADGTTETPDFRLDISDHPVPLHTEFHAVVDGTTGDTMLSSVRAHVLHSTLIASGSVIRVPEEHGHDTELDVTMENGRIEDMLALGVKASPALMRGALSVKTHISLPPGKVSVSRKVRLKGTFAIHGAIFNNPKMQEKLDEISMRAQGKPEEAKPDSAEVVPSSISGNFTLANAVLQASDIDYQMPGAQVQLEGEYRLDAGVYEFHGTVSTHATASQMTTGWKSLLLTPFDPLLKKNGAGMQIPIKVTGTKSTYDIHLDFGRGSSRKAPAPAPTPAPTK